MRRAALYARVSTEQQEREQTIQSQIAAITRYADQQGFRHTPALTYTDDGYSGTWLDRPALDELRDHAREGRFDVVVVLCPDRLARRYAYQVLLIEELKRDGIEIHFCERPINDSPDDQLLLQIQGAIAEYERAKILERCRRGRLHRARRGELAPPVTPYGYTYAARKYGGDGQIRIHEEEAAMVRQIFEWYAEDGGNVFRVQRNLNASTWKPRRGGRHWASGTILRILRNEWYIGRAYYNRITRRPRERSPGESADSQPPKPVVIERPRSEWIEVPVPASIDEALFARVQQRMAENRKFSKRRLRRHGTYLLKGLLKCGICGHTYVGYTQATRKKDVDYEYRYYKCRLRLEPRLGVQGACCTSRQLRVEGADEAVWTMIRRLLLNSEALSKELASWLSRTASDPARQERQAATAARLKDLRRQRERLIDAYQAGSLDLQDFDPRKTTIEERILTMEHEQAELDSWAARKELAIRQVAGAEAVVEQLRAQLRDPSFETKQAILRLVVEKVVVTGHRLEIHLALPVSGVSHLTYDRRARRSGYNFCASFNS
ncbi:MAG: recombinase family protein [Deltaproteobacteria bacterium]|nr:recombinase family protein [Deltaproteobacteria bacterium]